jgi:hypothetical protein
VNTQLIYPNMIPAATSESCPRNLPALLVSMLHVIAAVAVAAAPFIPLITKAVSLAACTPPTVTTAAFAAATWTPLITAIAAPAAAAAA